MMNKSITYILINLVLWLLVLNLMVLPVCASDFNQPITSQDKALFKEMLKPAFRLITLIQYLATVLAVLGGVYAGIMFVTAGGDVEKKEKSKSTIGLIVLGLAVVWAAPYVVEYLIS